MYSSQVSRFAFSDKIRNEVGIIAIQRLFWEGGITARQEPLNQTMVVGPLVGPFKTLLSILKGFNGIYIFYNRRYKITFNIAQDLVNLIYQVVAGRLTEMTQGPANV